MSLTLNGRQPIVVGMHSTEIVSQSTQNVINYLASFEMFKAPAPQHSVSVDWEPNNHGYPYRATCSCGWRSMPYAARHTAQDMAGEHV